MHNARLEGQEEGRAEGEEAMAIRIAKEMLAEGAEIQFISRVTKLTEDALLKLQI